MTLLAANAAAPILRILVMLVDKANATQSKARQGKARIA